MDASAKWLGHSLSPAQIIGCRYVVSFLIVILFFNPWRRPGLLRTARPGLQIVRGLCLIAASVCGWTAVRSLSLTQLTSITFSAPLIVAALAGPLLGERIGPRRALAVCVGFAGVLVVTRPFGTELKPATLLALGAAFANAFYSLATRRLAGHDAPETTMFYTSLVGSVVMAPALPLTWRPPPDARVWIVLIALGALGALAHWLLILAHKRAPASTLAPFFYAQLLAALAVGYGLFRELPDGWTCVGASVVASAGLYVFYRERVRAVDGNFKSR